MSLFSNHTLFIIIITVVVSLLAWKSPQLMQRLIFYPPAVQRGQVDRIVTHGFIHADGMHLFFNMFTLYSFGQAVQGLFMSKLGSLGFVLFYLAALVVAIMPTYLKQSRKDKKQRRRSRIDRTMGDEAIDLQSLHRRWIKK